MTLLVSKPLLRLLSTHSCRKGLLSSGSPLIGRNSYRLPPLRDLTSFELESDGELARDEANDVKSLDGLLNLVRSQSNPAYRSIIPLRTLNPWTESLINVVHGHTPPSRPSTPSFAPASSSLHRPLEPRRMHDSYAQLVLPFASSPDLLEQYVNAWGGLRLGKLLEHLDSLAGSIAYKHLLGPGVQTLGRIRERGFYVVTAAVDRLDMLSSLLPVRDIRISGHVIFTGRSSMEIVVRMEALEDASEDRTVMLGRFSMVCRDTETHKARPINPLIAVTPEEEQLLKFGEFAKTRKQVASRISLSKVPPTSEEAEALHNVYLADVRQEQGTAGAQPGDYERVWMGETKMENTQLMFPQERNVHQKVFGGHLMRLAYELGFADATMFTRRWHLRFLALDGIVFTRPVPIGSILRLTSQVSYTASDEFPTLVHVFVRASVVDVNTGSEEPTNDFRFTWCELDGEPLYRMVVPQTYAEAMAWIEGRRALQMGAKIRKLRKPFV